MQHLERMGQMIEIAYWFVRLLSEVLLHLC